MGGAGEDEVVGTGGNLSSMGKEDGGGGGRGGRGWSGRVKVGVKLEDSWSGATVEDTV